jgi:hypothetical protein
MGDKLRLRVAPGFVPVDNPAGKLEIESVLYIRIS